MSFTSAGFEQIKLGMVGGGACKVIVCASVLESYNDRWQTLGKAVELTSANRCALASADVRLHRGISDRSRFGFRAMDSRN